jgi:hypothetical protein
VRRTRNGIAVGAAEFRAPFGAPAALVGTCAGERGETLGGGPAGIGSVSVGTVGCAGWALEVTSANGVLFGGADGGRETTPIARAESLRAGTARIVIACGGSSTSSRSRALRIALVNSLITGNRC